MLVENTSLDKTSNATGQHHQLPHRLLHQQLYLRAVIALDGGGVRVKNLLVAEIGRWLHADALQAKSERTADIIAEIEESDNENSLLGDDTSEGEYDDVSDSDST